MRNLDDVELLELLPSNLRNDPDMIAASKVNDIWMRKVLANIDKILIWSNIDSMESDFLDMLAVQLHVDFYDQNLPIEKRREIVKNSDRWHAIKGTKAVVEELLDTVFDYSKLLEWFEYDGEPYHFKVAVNYTAGSAENIIKFSRLIDSVKNVRSYLEAIELAIRTNLSLKENIYKTNVTRNTKLGMWHLGIVPFGTLGTEVKIK